MVKKPVRTVSGVTPLTVVAKPYPCPHGRCIYCPGSDKVPQSYTDRSPAIMRAMSLAYDPYKQVLARLKAFNVMGHPTSKIEMIYLGGTFLAYPKDYQYDFVKACFDGLNGLISPSLEDAQVVNETAEKRCVAFCVETKPDWAFENDINRLLDFGVTRVELGVQLPDDEIYKKTNRGHTVADVIKATKLLKDSGFKVGYHVMTGLPDSSPEKDLNLFKMLFDDDSFRPDQLKLYPCQVIEGTPLFELHKRGLFESYSQEILIELLAKMKSLVPDYCRIMRLMRQFAPIHVKDGKFQSDLRNELKKYMHDNNLVCKCIRCREVGFAIRRNDVVDKKVAINVEEYSASGGSEFFISADNSQGLLFGLCRARIPKNPFRPEIKVNSLLIRELHVYGQEVSLGASPEVQHRGLGKSLMIKAEELASINNCSKVVVISGVGVREYYRKLGYTREGRYMVKDLKD